MKAADLRKSILQYAVEGKLVPQDIHDEPASLLYDKIIKEKETLIKQGKIKKEKPLPLITDDEIPYDIPENWKWVRLGEVCDVRDGTHDTPKYIPNGVPLITSKNISNNMILFDNVKYISIDDYRAIANRSFVDIGDILFAMIGSIGNPVIVNINKQFAIKNVALFKFHQNHFFYNKYLLIFLQLNQYIMQKKSSGAVQSFVSLKFLREYLFPLPPLKEQERIVKKVDELMALCDKLEQEEEKLSTLDEHFADTLPKSILQYAVEGKLIPQDIHDEPASILYDKIIKEKENLIKQGKIKKEKPLPPITNDEIPYDIPENWKWVRLGEVAKFENGDRSNKYPTEIDLQSDGIPFISSKDIIKNKIKITETTKYIKDEKFKQLNSGKLINNDIVFCLRGSVGKHGIFNVTNHYKTGFINAQLIIIRMHNKINIKYIDNYFDTPLFKEILAKYISGSAVTQISATLLQQLLFPLPPLKEQERIIKKVDELLTYCNKLKDII